MAANGPDGGKSLHPKLLCGKEEADVHGGNDGKSRKDLKFMHNL